MRTTHYFAINGNIAFQNELKEVNVVRRYSDFEFLHVLICDRYFYKIIPLLPPKDITMLLTINKDRMNKRLVDLQNYVNDLINIPKIFDFTPVQEFFFENANFQLLTQNPEYKNIYNKKKSLMNGVKTAMNSFADFFNNSNKVFYDNGFYNHYTKEIGTLTFFVENLMKNLTTIKKNFMNILKNISILVSRTEQKDNSNHSEKFLNKFKFSKNTNQFCLDEVILALEEVDQKLKACQ